jgi:hypothetical protein
MNTRTFGVLGSIFIVILFAIMGAVIFFPLYMIYCDDEEWRAWTKRHRLWVERMDAEIDGRHMESKPARKEETALLGFSDLYHGLFRSGAKSQNLSELRKEQDRAQKLHQCLADVILTHRLGEIPFTADSNLLMIHARNIIASNKEATPRATAHSTVYNSTWHDLGTATATES